jgi:transcriptional regulator of arginine metabolism
MGLEEVLGTISGRDNMVFIALREGSSGEDLVVAMKKKIPELELD